MTFLNPWGLLGLIGIPVLILIYIITSKYSEQTIPSTYLWRLSEKFLKRKNNVSKFTGIISLILQLLMILAASLAISRPVITMKDAAKEYCFIIDASASMNIEKNDKTRFDEGKERISQIVEDSVDGSVYTLICVSENTTRVVDKTADKQVVLSRLDSLDSAFAQDDFTDAVSEAQKIFDNNNSALIYLVTDKEYKDVSNIEVINVAKKEVNSALNGFTHTFTGDGKLEINASATAYNETDTVTVSLYLNGAKTPNDTKTVKLNADRITEFTLSCYATSYTSIEVRIEDEDAMVEDNSLVLYNTAKEKIYNIVLVSNNDFYLKSILEAVTQSEVVVRTPEEFNKDNEVYGMYVFDGCVPTVMPTSGTVWFVNPTATVSGSGFTVRGVEDIELKNQEPLELTSNSSTVAAELRQDITGDDIYITQYVNCGFNRNFTTLYTFDADPVIFAGTSVAGNREVVIAFDLHNSILPLLTDYSIIIKNLVDYSFPDVIDSVECVAGEEMIINLPSDARNVKIVAPSGAEKYLFDGQPYQTYVPTEVGVHTIVISEKSEYHFHVRIHESESVPTVVVDEPIALVGEYSEGGLDGTFNPIWIIMISIAVLFMAEWGLYCYDKYQLR